MAHFPESSDQMSENQEQGDSQLEHIHCVNFMDGFIHLMRKQGESGKLFFAIEFFDGICTGFIELEEKHASRDYSGAIFLKTEAIMKDIQEVYVNFVYNLKVRAFNTSCAEGRPMYVH